VRLSYDYNMTQSLFHQVCARHLRNVIRRWSPPREMQQEKPATLATVRKQPQQGYATFENFDQQSHASTIIYIIWVATGDRSMYSDINEEFSRCIASIITGQKIPHEKAKTERVRITAISVHDDAVDLDHTYGIESHSSMLNMTSARA
jgi:hypothetical protein